MFNENPGIKLFTIIGLALGGMIIVGVFTILAVFMAEGSLEAAMTSLQTARFTSNAGLTRVVLFIQHFGMFILPAFIFGLIYYRPNLKEGFNVNHFPTLQTAILGIVFIFVALPLVNLSFLLNEQINLPEWASMFEAQANDTLQSILEMNHFGVFLINFLLIALLPAIGEELIFRGIIQKYIGKLVKSPIVGIWLAAIIFSAIHMQFEGFFPRMVLGAILGYLYYWTNNLWVPILAHLFNNGLQVAMVYFTDIDLSAVESNTEMVTWWMVLGSVVLLYFIYSFLIQQKDPNVGVT